MMHVTALMRTPPATDWKVLGHGVGSNLAWAAAACFVPVLGKGIKYEEADGEARVSRLNADGTVACEWRIVPSPGSRPDPDAPPYRQEAIRPRVNGNGKPALVFPAKPATPAVNAPKARAGRRIAEVGEEPAPRPLPPIPPRGAITRVRFNQRPAPQPPPRRRISRGSLPE